MLHSTVGDSKHRCILMCLMTHEPGVENLFPEGEFLKEIYQRVLLVECSDYIALLVSDFKHPYEIWFYYVAEGGRGGWGIFTPFKKKILLAIRGNDFFCSNKEILARSCVFMSI